MDRSTSTKWNRGLATAAAVLVIAAAGCKDKGGASSGKQVGDDDELPVEAPRTSVPQDFVLSYFASPVQADDGDGLEVILAADGNGGFALWRVASRPPRGSSAVTKRKSAPVVVPPEEVLAIYREVVRQRYFELEESYRNPAVMDGSTMSLEITANGNTKRVQVTNTEVPQVAAILALLPPPPPLPRSDEEADAGGAL